MSKTASPSDEVRLTRCQIKGQRVPAIYHTTDQRFRLVGEGNRRNWERDGFDKDLRRRPGRAARNSGWRIGYSNKASQQDRTLLAASGLCPPPQSADALSYPFRTLREAWQALQLVAYPEQVTGI